MEEVQGTPFYHIYCNFLNRITDDYYMETTVEETFENLQDLLKRAIPGFQFPKFPLYDIDWHKPTIIDPDTDDYISYGMFNHTLTLEEQNILAELMLLGWLEQQLATVNLTRMKYSTQDFKFTSQANHLSKLQLLKDNFRKENISNQRMYQRRRINDKGMIVANYEGLSTPGVESENREYLNNFGWWEDTWISYYRQGLTCL